MLKFLVDPRDLPAGDFPVKGTSRERHLFLLRYAILAPSSRNMQPWKFAVERNDIGLFADRTRWLKAADPGRRDFHLSLGCALENLLVAARHFGYQPKVAYFPRAALPDLVALVSLGPRKASPAAATRPIEAITRRHSNYRKYAAGPLDPKVLAMLDRAGAAEGIEVFLTTDPGIKHAAATLLGRAAALQLADPAFREEVGEFDSARPGLHLGGWTVSQVQEAVARDVELMARAPLFGVVLSKRADAVAQVRSGQALERIWLAAARFGASLRPASALCAVARIRDELERLVGAGELHVQQAFRLGFSEGESLRADRRRVERVLVDTPLA